MILVKENLSFIQNAQRDTSWVGKAKYQIAGRITTLGTSLLLLSEAVARAALACLAAVGFALSFGCWEKARDFVENQMQKAKEGSSIAFDGFVSVFSSKGLQSRLIEGTMGGVVRENRLRLGSDLIQSKLRKEFIHAQNQMMLEPDKAAFHYLEGNLGSVEAERVGEFDVGVCHFIGRRPTMEDEHLAKSFELKINGKNYPVQLFGIFDGHGGPEASKFLKGHLKETLEKTLIELNASGLTDEGIWNALKMTFVRLNEDFRNENAGSTATVAMILDGKLWTANVGDSRTILDNNGQVIQLSEDAKPSDERYEKGIRHRGGSVFWNMGMRVNGVLAVARSIGDHSLNGAISARPKITAISIKDIMPGSHLVLTCDGIYDVASTRQVGQAVRAHRGDTPATLAKNLVFSAYNAQSQDNLSAMVIKFA